eukprot:5989458-Prymnesium_polylepis.1
MDGLVEVRARTRSSCQTEDGNISCHGWMPPVIQRPCWNARSLTSILGMKSRMLPGTGCSTTAIRGSAL